MRLFAKIVALLPACGVLSQRLDKPAAWVDPDLKYFDPILNGIPSAEYVGMWPWVNGIVSKACYDKVQSQDPFDLRTFGAKDIKNFRQYDVRLGDCNQVWLWCREDGAQVSLEDSIAAFARVPVGMRSFMSEIVQYKGASAAVTSNTFPWTVTMSGDYANSTRVFIHEGSHCVDLQNANGMTSDSSTWLAAYNNDTHVADEYALNNQWENYAQYASLVVVDRWTNGRSLQQPQHSEVLSQMTAWAAAADSHWGDHMLDFAGYGKNCSHRLPNSHPVDQNGNPPSNHAEDNLAPQDPDIVIMEVSAEEIAKPGPATICKLI